jgi:RimJ/RimL family protein N-acetyltransferase
MLIGNQTILRPFEKKDIIFYHKWMEDPATVAALYGSSILHYKAQIEATYLDFMAKPDQMLLLMIETKEGKRPVGLCFVKNIHPVHRHAELEQMHIIAECQNRGLGKDALGTVLNYLFLEMNLNRVWLIAHAGNLKAIGLYLRLGFIKEGLLRQVHFRNGCYQDAVIMAGLKDDWLKLKDPGR